MPKEGEIIEARVKNYKKGTGIFVDLGDHPEGLIEEKNIVGNPERGQTIYVKVGARRTNDKISLSMRDVPQQPPWWILRNSFFVTDPESGKEILNEKLLTEFASQLAKASAGKLKINGLRNFYDAFKSIEGRLNQVSTSTEKDLIFRQQLPIIKMMKSRVAHSLRKSPPVIPDIFADFLNQCIDIITKRRDFEGFMLLFEAVAGWHTYFGKGQ